MKDLHGKTALVTGGATGIGLAAGHLMAERGARVALLGPDAGQLDEAIALLRAHGLDGQALLADVRDDAAMASAFATIEAQHGSLSILVCNAAIQPYGTVETMPPAAWDSVIDINLRGAYLASHLAIPLMKKHGGSIIHVTSVQGSATQERVAAYTTSKGGLLALTRAMAVDHARDGIRVNAVSPGCIDAPMTHFAARENAAAGQERAMIASWGKMQPLGRVGLPHEVAEMIAFLASDKASFCTGSEYRVDGGLLAKLGVVLPDED